MQLAGAKVVPSLKGECLVAVCSEIVVGQAVGESGMATAGVVDVEARGEEYGVFPRFDARVDANVVEKRVVVLYEPCVGVVGHAYAID